MKHFWKTLGNACLHAACIAARLALILYFTDLIVKWIDRHHKEED